MKTTVDISDALLIEAKKLAATQRRPLRAVFEEALRRLLHQESATKRIRWVVASGGLPMDIESREVMHETLRRGT